MKKLLTLIVLIAAMATAYAQTAKIYFLRNTGKQQGYINAHLYIDTHKVCTAKTQEFGVLEVNPGTHTFAVGLGKSDASAPLKITTEAGKDYFFAFTMDDFYGVYEITEAMANQLMAKAKEIDCKKSIQ